MYIYTYVYLHTHSSNWDISAGFTHSCALSADTSKLYTWGSKRVPPCHKGPPPVALPGWPGGGGGGGGEGGEKWVHVVCGREHTVAIAEVWAGCLSELQYVLPSSAAMYMYIVYMYR